MNIYQESIGNKIYTYTMDADEYTDEDNPFSYHLTIFAHIVWKVKQIKFYHRLTSCTKYRIVKYG